LRSGGCRRTGCWRSIAAGYVELIRNLPLLFQILFWYLAVLATLPNPAPEHLAVRSVFLSNRGLVIPNIVRRATVSSLFIVALRDRHCRVAIADAALRAQATLCDGGKVIKVWPYVLASADRPAAAQRS
jgi:general L-amino acid transport system permease protein